MGFLDDIDLKQYIVIGFICFIGTQLFLHFFGLPGFLSFGSSNSKPNKPFAKEKQELVYKDYTPKELYEFRGADPEKPLLMAVKGTVFDVSRGAAFYGPEGPYHNFAGRDASRGLSKNSFEDDVLVPLDQPIDELKDLDEEEVGSLNQWFDMFTGKYIEVGKLVNAPEHQTSS